MKHTSSFSLSLEEKVKVNQLLFFSLPELKINRKGERENKKRTTRDDLEAGTPREKREKTVPAVSIPSVETWRAKKARTKIGGEIRVTN